MREQTVAKVRPIIVLHGTYLHGTSYSDWFATLRAHEPDARLTMPRARRWVGSLFRVRGRQPRTGPGVHTLELRQ